MNRKPVMSKKQRDKERKMVITDYHADNGQVMIFAKHHADNLRIWQDIYWKAMQCKA